MKIIITGATGALGSALVKYFSTEGHSILAVGRMIRPPANLLKYATYTQADITRSFTLPKADVCIHAAALSDDKGDQREFIKANVDGTRNVVQAASHCPTFIYVSSSSVYLPANVALTEEMAMPGNLSKLPVYGRSKLLSELALKEVFRGARCFILRPRALYGEGDIKIFPRILRLVKNKALFRPGSMKNKVSLTHYQNFCEAVDLCIRSTLEGIHTFNVADDKKYRLIEIVRKVTGTLYGRRFKERKASVWFARLLASLRIGGLTPLLVRGLTKDMYLDISRIKNRLGYTARKNFNLSLPDIRNWVESIGGVEELRKARKDLPWR